MEETNLYYMIIKKTFLDLFWKCFNYRSQSTSENVDFSDITIIIKKCTYNRSSLAKRTSLRLRRKNKSHTLESTLNCITQFCVISDSGSTDGFN